MIIDNKGKLFGKISIVDLVVVFVFVVAAFGVVLTKMKLDTSEIMSNDSNMLIQSSAAMDTMEIKLKVKEVRDITRDAVIVGDDVYLMTNDRLLGSVVRVESEPAIREVIGNHGVVYRAEVPQRYDVTIVVEAKGKKKEDGYFTGNNIQLLYGREMGIKTSTIQTIPTVAGIEMIETEE